MVKRFRLALSRLLYKWADKLSRKYKKRDSPSIDETLRRIKSDVDNGLLK